MQENEYIFAAFSDIKTYKALSHYQDIYPKSELSLVFHS